MASPPGLDGPRPIRPLGGSRAPESPESKDDEEEDLGRMDEDASLGRPELPFRELLLLGAVARFLDKIR